MARLDSLVKEDTTYAEQIAKTVIAGEVRSLNPKNTSISTATKVEALAALSQVFIFRVQSMNGLTPKSARSLLLCRGAATG